MGLRVYGFRGLWGLGFMVRQGGRVSLPSVEG